MSSKTFGGIYRQTVYSRPVLREPTFLILSAVAPEPLHGYGIIQAVERISGGRITLRAGTLYSALERMVGDRWLRVEGEEVVDGRLRRYYQLTEIGAEVLSIETQTLEANAKAARQQLALRIKAGVA